MSQILFQLPRDKEALKIRLEPRKKLFNRELINNIADIFENVENSGEILLGNYTPFSAANYSIGITAVLPTNGFAQSFSGITSKDMVKTSTMGSLSKSALNKLRPSIESLGKHEGLPCHIEAARVRLD